MYHIKSDKRSQASAAEIVRGLQECLKTTPLKAITVTDIHRVTGISRATFYRLFDTPEDVLHYQFEQMMTLAAERRPSERKLSSRELMEQTISLGMEYHELLKALVDNGRFDLLYRYTEKSFRMPDLSESLVPEGTDPAEREYILTQAAMSMVATLITWAKNGRRETAAEIVEYLKRYVKIVSAVIEEE